MLIPADMPGLSKLLARTKQEGDCLLWTGQKSNSGYGHAWYGGEKRLAHRASFLAFRGVIPATMWVLHLESCVSKLCINPLHLSIGTPSENAISAWEAGKSNHRKLSQKEIDGARWLLDNGVPSRIVAKVYNVNKYYFNTIKHREKRRAQSGRPVRPGVEAATQRFGDSRSGEHSGGDAAGGWGNRFKSYPGALHAYCEAG